jgi:hypothetical protein
VKRGALMMIVGMATLLLLTSCKPTAIVATEVVPTLISVQARDPSAVVLQGRYFGGGGGDSYVLISTAVDGEGGMMVEASQWSPTRIVFAAPEGSGGAFVIVVADGRRSNPLPANLP